MAIEIEKLKYPIGKFQKPKNITADQIEEWTKTIEDFPERLKEEVKNLTKVDLQKQYRANGWTIEQVVNHCADSHMNSFIRFKLALTEETPTIKPYFEDLWAELADSKNNQVRDSLLILEGLHARWTTLLRQLSDTDWNREFVHPETGEKISLKTNIGFYAWHCEHHLAHIKNAKRN